MVAQGWAWIWEKQTRDDSQGKLTELVVMGAGFKSHAAAYNAMRTDATPGECYYIRYFGKPKHVVMEAL